jgi:hypothetical protein
VSHPFDLLDFGSLRREGACVSFGGAEFTALGTGLLVGKPLGLLREEELECSFGQPSRGRGGDLLEGAEVDIEARSVVAECPLGNDFRPLSGEVVEFPEFLGRKSWRGHGSSCPDVTSMTTSGLPIPW